MGGLFWRLLLLLALLLGGHLDSYSNQEVAKGGEIKLVLHMFRAAVETPAFRRTAGRKVVLASSKS